MDKTTNDRSASNSLLGQLVSIGSLACAIFSGIAAFAIHHSEFTSCMVHGDEYLHFHITMISLVLGVVVTWFLCACAGIITIVRDERAEGGIGLMYVLSIIVLLLAVVTFFVPMIILWHADPTHMLVWHRGFYKWPPIPHKCMNNRTIYYLASFSAHWFSVIGMLMVIAIGVAVLMGVCACAGTRCSKQRSSDMQMRHNDDYQTPSAL